MNVIISLSAKDPIDKKPRIQSGVVPYRVNPSTGEIEVLMIRTKHAKNWGLPKGGKEDHLTLKASALKEADEEAGAIGTPGKKVMETEYVKGSTGRRQHVTWFLMTVTRTKDNYLEAKLRQRKWFTLDKALKKIDRGFHPILKKAAKMLRKNS